MGLRLSITCIQHKFHILDHRQALSINVIAPRKPLLLTNPTHHRPCHSLPSCRTASDESVSPGNQAAATPETFPNAGRSQTIVAKGSRVRGRSPAVSPELEALVAKHAPQELHLLRQAPRPPLPRRGPRLTDLLADSGLPPPSPGSPRVPLGHWARTSSTVKAQHPVTPTGPKLQARRLQCMR